MKAISKRPETTFALTPSQKEMIRKRIAPEATDDELTLFFYICEKRGLDPLLNQISFVKRKRKIRDGAQERWETYHVVQTSIDGFRVIAARSKQICGTKRGVVYNEDGTIRLGWAEVYRKDWAHPARIELDFKEYVQFDNSGKPMGLWGSKPSTMIQKCAEAAALRMAFPEDLSGMYENDEIHQEAHVEPVPKPALTVQDIKNTDDNKYVRFIQTQQEKYHLTNEEMAQLCGEIRPDEASALETWTKEELEALWESMKNLHAKKAEVVK